MSQIKVPKLKVINKAPGSLSTGANTKVLLDDKPLDSIYFLKIELKAKKVAKVTMEMYADIDIELDTEPIIEQAEAQPGANYALSQYSPKFYNPNPTNQSDDGESHD